MIPMNNLNQSLFQLIYGLSNHNFFLDGFFIFCAEYLPYLLMILFLFLVFNEDGTRRRWYLFLEAIMAIILSRGLITEIIRFFYYNPRPFEALGFTSLIPESGASFPSGHAAWFFALAMVIFFRNKKWGSFFFVCALIMGFARIYAGVHWPLDVLGGIVVGICSAVFVHWLLKDSRQKLYSERATLSDIIENKEENI